MNLLMISGDRMLLSGKRGAFAEMLQEFRTHWDRIDIITPAGSGERLADSTVPFDNVFVHPNPKGLWHQPGWITQKGSELIDAHGHAVMTVHEYPPFYNGTGARRLRRMKNIPMVLEIHHIVGWPRSASLSEFFGRWLSRFVLPREARDAQKVRVVNRTVSDELVSWGVDPAKISVVPSFYLDHDLLNPDSSHAKRFDIAFCGRLVPNKGLFEFLRAVSGLAGTRAVVIGDGPLKCAAQEFARALRINDRVTFTGWLDTHADVIRHMRSAKIFVMNSRSEGGPRVALEAMACGLPVIATRVGVMPEVIEDGVNGLFTDGTVAHLQATMKRLLADDALRSTVAVNAAKIIARFEKKKAIREYAHFLQSASR